jgi:hypothetical protein
VSVVTVIAIPALTVSSGAICNGQSYTINPTGADTYTYLPTNVSVVSPATTQTYGVIGTNTLTGCVSNSAALTVTVNALPTVSINASNTLCAGSSMTLTASGATTYSWISVGSGSAIAVSPASSIVYTVVGTSSSNCSSSAIQSVTVLTPPSISAAGGTICPGDSFTISPTGANTYTYSGGSSTVSPVVTTTYTVTGTDNQGCNTTSPATVVVTVTNNLVVTASGNTLICAGQTSTLTATGANLYTWLTTPTVGTGTLITSPGATTAYTVVGTSAACTASAVISVSVNPLPAVAAHSTSSLICVGETAILTATGASNYTWSPAGTGSATIQVTGTTAGQLSYTVMGIDNNGCVNSAIVTQSVDACLGVEKVQNTQFQLYPNPNLGEFVIEGPHQSTIMIHNALGQVIMTRELHEGKNQINLGENAKGVYFVKYSAGSVSRTIKIVKQ